MRQISGNNSNDRRQYEECELTWLSMHRAMEFSSRPKALHGSHSMAWHLAPQGTLLLSLTLSVGEIKSALHHRIKYKGHVQRCYALKLSRGLWYSLQIINRISNITRVEFQYFSHNYSVFVSVIL